MYIMQVQTLLLQLVKDPSQDVVDACFEHLLPGLLGWMSDINLLHTSLLPAVLSDVRALVERYAQTTPTDLVCMHIDLMGNTRLLSCL